MNKTVRTSVNGFRLNRNGKAILTDVGEKVKNKYEGELFKENGVYYYFDRKRGDKFIYKP